MAMIWTYKRGAEGKILTGTLTQGDGVTPIDLTAKTVKLSAKYNDTSVPVISLEDVTVISAPAGTISYTVSPTAAAVAQNLDGYLMEFAIIQGSNVDYIPTDADYERTYGRLIVQEPLVMVP